MGWFNAVLFSTAVGTGLKLFSSALQQKLIGENLSHYVKIRQFVGINSQMMRAMRLVLGKSGINVPKVAILIGGPDWPTSVLCGIMRLSLIQIMIGTLPIIILIFPTCLMGALVYMASLDSETGNPEIPWAGTAATIVASITAAVQFGSMLVAAYYLEQAGEHRKDEVDAIEIDQEVKEADERDEHKKKCYTTVTQWRSVPMLPKALLVTAVVCITASCYLVQFFSSLCFVEHELTDTMENLEGNVLNLFLPLGWVAVTLFFKSMCFLSIFTRWGNSKANELANSGNGPMLSKSQLA
jgi:TRAP-type C4-dicarboxylate transport system permease small subunit